MSTKSGHYSPHSNDLLMTPEREYIDQSRCPTAERTTPGPANLARSELRIRLDSEQSRRYKFLPKNSSDTWVTTKTRNNFLTQKKNERRKRTGCLRSKRVDAPFPGIWKSEKCWIKPVLTGVMPFGRLSRRLKRRLSRQPTSETTTFKIFKLE